MTPTPVLAQDADPSPAEHPAAPPESPAPADAGKVHGDGDAETDAGGDEDSEEDEEEDDGETPSASGSDGEAGWSFKPPLTTLLHTPVDITGGFAVNPFFMPAIQTKLGMRFPGKDFSWGLAAGYSYGPVHMLFPGQEPLPQHVSLGFQWYALDLVIAQLYWHLTGGYLFQTAHQVGGVTVPLAGVPTVMTGVGVTIGTPTSFGWLPPSALNVGVDLGYPFIIRPEFSLRVTI
jgi:hypothetical protein